MKTTIIFTSLIMFFSCNQDKKVCDFVSENEELLIYNHVLTELIEKHMYRAYLGARGDEVREKYLFSKDPDTVRYDEETTKIHNDIFKKRSELCTLYLDTQTRPQFFYDSVQYERNSEFKTFIAEYTNHCRAAIDSLNGLQQRYSPEDFGLCTARVRSIKDWKNDSTCVIGVLRLSKLLLNQTRNKGLLYYDWHCGGLCGHRGIICFEKNIGLWQIKGFAYNAIY